VFGRKAEPINVRNMSRKTPFTHRIKNFLGVETKGALSEPPPWLIDLFGAQPTNAGVVVTPRAAMACAPVHCAVQAISEAMGQLPVNVLRQSEDGSKESDTSHPAYSLLHDAANDWTSASQFREQITRDALLYPHGGLAHIIRAEGKPVELIRIDREREAVSVTYENYEPVYKIGDQTFDRQNILHIPSPSLNGCGLITEGREAIGLAITLERHAARLFGNSARPSGLLSLKESQGPGLKRVTTPDEIEKIAAAWNATLGNNKSGGTAVLPAAVEWQQVTLNSVDAQFNEMRVHAVSEIARLFRVPTSLLYQLDRVTHSNAEQLGQEFLNYCLMAWIARFEGEFLLKLFTKEERSSYSARFETDEFLRADFLALMEGLGKGVAARIFSPNEAREKLGKAPYAGGDKFENPNTTTASLTV